MLRAGTVEAEVGMEVSVDQEFSPDLNDNTSKAYRDFNKTFQDQVRGKGRGSEVSSEQRAPSGPQVQA